TVGLDPVQIREVRDLINNLATSGKHTIILSTHILPEVTASCRKVLVINGGKLVDFDTLEALHKKYAVDRPSSLEEIYLKLIDPSGAMAQKPAVVEAPPPAAAIN
ncbi:MAG: hypothetical protein ACK4N5_24400, partial [Myxococcales bacterium]